MTPRIWYTLSCCPGWPACTGRRGRRRRRPDRCA
jgi:hypothetical protein